MPDNQTVERDCPFGDDCDLTAAYLAGYEKASAALAAMPSPDAQIAEARREALREAASIAKSKVHSGSGESAAIHILARIDADAPAQPATLADGTVQDRAHRLIHRGLVTLASDMLFRGVSAPDVAEEFIAAGLVQIHHQDGEVLVSMDGINGAGPTREYAFRRWLATATCHYADEAQSEGAITAARLQ